jgi:hypothetical protein
MPDALSFSEIDGQHVELLPARTVLSLFSLGGGGSNVVSTPSCQSAINQNPGLLGLLGTENTADFTCVGSTASSH